MHFQFMLLVARCIPTELPTMPTKIATQILDDDGLQMIWGAAAIGAVLNLTERQAFFQLEAGRIPGARKVRPELGRIRPGFAPGSHRGGPADRCLMK
jgi:hypothetical protein